MNKILIYAAVAVLVLVLILGYWQFFVGYACGLATFWFLGEHTLRMAAGNLCSKGKEIGNELGVSANLVCAWISKARKYLKSCPEILALTGT